jgi:hypothetical protein
LLAASNEENFKASVPKEAVNGGFVGRSLVVHAIEERCVNSLMDKPASLIDNNELASHLKELAKVKGQFVIEDIPRKFYDAWYKDFKTQKKKAKDPTGTVQRIPDNVLKVAMLLSLSRDTGLQILTNDIDEAIEVCTICFGGTKQLSMGAGASALAPATAKVLNELVMAEDQTLSRRKILRRCWGDFDAYDLDRIAETLIQSGAVTVSTVGAEIFYKMTKKTFELYKSFKSED